MTMGRQIASLTSFARNDKKETGFLKKIPETGDVVTL
jgi:hypothetical protein